MRSQGADLVIMEIHGGFQFSDVASEFATRAAHTAIDAGADLVIGHHPHVLQGFEWYKGHLIAYSLGNFVFDQDFLSTFPSVILRTIFEGDRLIDARIIPLVLDRYQPVPVAGAAAARVIRLVNARSALTAYSERIEPRIIGGVIDQRTPGNATISDNAMTGTITDQRDSSRVSYQLDGAGQVRLPPCALVRTDSFTGQFGFDLLQWGDLDDATADNDTEGAALWSLAGNVRAEVDVENQFLRLAPTKVRGTSARPTARSTTPLHRWFDAKFLPVDGEPEYTWQMRTRGTGVIAAFLKLAVYDVDDTDPTTEPESTLLKETSVPLAIGDSTDWRDLEVDLSAILNERSGSLRPERCAAVRHRSEGVAAPRHRRRAADGVAGFARHCGRCVGAGRCPSWASRTPRSPSRSPAARLPPARPTRPLQFEVPTSPIGRACNAASVAAPKEQPPRNLSGKRTAREGNAGKQRHSPLAEGEIRPIDMIGRRSSQVSMTAGEASILRSPGVVMTSTPRRADRCRRVHPSAHVRDRRRPAAHAVGDRRAVARRPAWSTRCRRRSEWPTSLALAGPRSPESVLGELRELSALNSPRTSLIGMGYYGTDHAAGDRAQRAREPGVVHGVHARTSPRSARAGSRRC